MKKVLKKQAIILSTLVVIILFSQCKNKCEGYEGNVTEPHAVALRNACHFIKKDSILAWNARYEANKNLISHDSLGGVGNVMASPSSSFNNCIVKKLICNDSSIGLRVLNGMDKYKKVHIMLVGINPDYTNLYINEPKECCTQKSMAQTLDNKKDSSNAGSGKGKGDLGGAEYGMNP